MILDVLEDLDVLAGAIAVWIVVGCAAVTVAGWSVAWAVYAVTRGLRGARSAAEVPEMERETRDAPAPPQAPYSDSSYQEAA